MDGCPGGSNKVNALVWQVVIPLRNVRAHLEISTMKSDGGSGLSTVFGMVYVNEAKYIRDMIYVKRLSCCKWNGESN